LRKTGSWSEQGWRHRLRTARAGFAQSLAARLPPQWCWRRSRSPPPYARRLVVGAARHARNHGLYLEWLTVTCPVRRGIGVSVAGASHSALPRCRFWRWRDIEAALVVLALGVTRLP